MMRNQRQILIVRVSLLVIVISMMMTIACGPPRKVVKVGGMVPASMTLSERHDGAVSLHCEGGQEMHIMGLPMIPNEAFLEALKTAIEQSGVFSQVVSQEGALYRLEAFIFNLSQPMFIGGDVSVEIAWTLEHAGTGEVIWQEAITTMGTGYADEDSSYSKRLATEQAAKENIKTALEKMSTIQ